MAWSVWVNRVAEVRDGANFRAPAESVGVSRGIGSVTGVHGIAVSFQDPAVACGFAGLQQSAMMQPCGKRHPRELGGLARQLRLDHAQSQEGARAGGGVEEDGLHGGASVRDRHP